MSTKRDNKDKPKRSILKNVCEVRAQQAVIVLLLEMVEKMAFKKNSYMYVFYWECGWATVHVAVCLLVDESCAVKTRRTLPNLLPLNCATFSARQLFDKRLTLGHRQINRLATK